MIVDCKLAVRLATRRLESPGQIKDRGARCIRHYDIGGGKAWSQSVSSAAERAFGWSDGAHGLRCSYTQERMLELQNRGWLYNDAREVISQELGLFRADAVETYFR